MAYLVQHIAAGNLNDVFLLNPVENYQRDRPMYQDAARETFCYGKSSCFPENRKAGIKIPALFTDSSPRGLTQLKSV